jgi:hypothetical protein
MRSGATADYSVRAAAVFPDGRVVSGSGDETL